MPQRHNNALLKTKHMMLPAPVGLLVPPLPSHCDSGGGLGVECNQNDDPTVTIIFDRTSVDGK